MYDTEGYRGDVAAELPPLDRAINDLKAANGDAYGFMPKPEDAKNPDYVMGLINAIDGNPPIKDALKAYQKSLIEGVAYDGNVWQELNELTKPKKKAA